MMKGLLTKDFALFCQRKRTFLLLALLAIMMCFTMKDGSFVISWMTIIASFFAVSSLTYDEYDNCYPFLMSLPVTRKIYAIEKYVFGFLCGFGAWIYAVILSFVCELIIGTCGNFLTELVSAAIFIPLFMLLIDISLPLNLKFGSEKGRIAILILWGVIFVGFLGATKFFHLDISTQTVRFFQPGILFPVSFAASVFLTVVSILLSIQIMEKKAF